VKITTVSLNFAMNAFNLRYFYMTLYSDDNTILLKTRNKTLSHHDQESNNKKDNEPQDPINRLFQRFVGYREVKFDSVDYECVKPKKEESVRRKIQSIRF